MEIVSKHGYKDSSGKWIKPSAWEYYTTVVYFLTPCFEFDMKGGFWWLWVRAGEHVSVECQWFSELKVFDRLLSPAWTCAACSAWLCGRCEVPLHPGLSTEAKLHQGCESENKDQKSKPKLFQFDAFYTPVEGGRVMVQSPNICELPLVSPTTSAQDNLTTLDTHVHLH